VRHFSILLFACGLAAAADVNFQSPKSIANGSPFYLSQGDFNGDRRPDLLVTGFAQYGGNNALTLFEGLGGDRFGRGVVIYQAQFLHAAIVADFNHDGKQDIAALNAPLSNQPGTLTVLLGNGDGTFQAPVNATTLTGPEALIAGDFNHDGKLDVALIAGGQQLQIFLGNGDGSFQAPVNTALPNFASLPNSLAAADFNRDGKLDVAVAVSGPGFSNIVVLQGNGDGTFQSPATLTPPGGAFVLAAADLNGDHIPDLVAAASSPDSVQVLIGKGDGAFLPPVSYTIARFPSNVLIIDVNGDQKFDLVVVARSSTSPPAEKWPCC